MWPKIARNVAKVAQTGLSAHQSISILETKKGKPLAKLPLHISCLYGFRAALLPLLQHSRR